MGGAAGLTTGMSGDMEAFGGNLPPAAEGMLQGLGPSSDMGFGQLGSRLITTGNGLQPPYPADPPIPSMPGLPELPPFSSEMYSTPFAAPHTQYGGADLAPGFSPSSDLRRAIVAVPLPLTKQHKG